MSAAFRWSPYHARLHQVIRQRGLLSRKQRLLVAVSGGQDSLCLAQLLLDLQPHWEWQLAIAHCNHRWRPDADENADYVESLAQTWQLPFYGRTATEPIPSEAAARDWRYGVLEEVARREGWECVVTGHTASDRAETLLYNLVRGSGADGLQALAWSRPLGESSRLVRPLLEFLRSETAQVCEERQLEIWYDATNENLAYARNRIRQELLPYLRDNLNPQVESHLGQTAELLRADVELLEELATTVREQACHPDSPYALNRKVLQTAPLALQRRVVRQFLQGLLPNTPTYDQVEKVVRLISAPNQTQTDPLSGGAIARISQDWIQLHARQADPNGSA